MKKCPRCGAMSFCVTAHVTQDWVVDENGNFLKSNNDCVEVTHFPEDDDIWDCNNCGFSDVGHVFNHYALSEINFHEEDHGAFFEMV